MAPLLGTTFLTTTGEISFTRGEVEKLIRACKALEDEVMVRLAATTGLRRADLSHIRIENVNLTEGSLTYNEKKKGGRLRTIPLSPLVLQKIEQHIATLGKSGISDQEGFLFAWGKRKYGDKTAWYHLQALCERAGIPGRPFHAFRATAVKLMQQAKFSPEEVARITGDTIPVIQRHYATPTGAELAAKVNEKELI